MVASGFRRAVLVTRFAAVLLAGTTAAPALAVPAAGRPAPQPNVSPANLPAATVTQDALPTVQVNGVVWDQTTVGNTVYAVGDFTSARPAGSPLGTNETPRTDILAYDITTGKLITSFDHTLDGEVQVVRASPDGSRIYIGGQFTSVDGQARYRIAAFDTATGALDTSFAPATNADVTAIAATNSTVYFGGDFGVVNGLPRTRLAAVTSAGALTTWRPSADRSVNAMLLTPGASPKLVVAGSFDTLNGATVHGMGALSPATGVRQPWAMGSVTTNGTATSGFLTLSTDGTNVYTGGWDYGQGDFEGTAELNPSTGAPVWINDCWGDVYATYPHAGALYTSSHAHDCSGAGFFPDQSPSVYHFGLAYSTTASSARNVKDGRGWDYSAEHTSSLLQWNPTFTSGTFTGTDQATWSVTGSGNYVAFGGEFPTVNGTAQQGLVRFTTHANAPNAYGPSALGTITGGASPTRARITTSTRGYDPDDGYLTYELIRDGDTANPVVTGRVLTPHFWQPKPPVAMTDPSVTPGATYTYRMRIVDAGGSATGTNTVTVTIPAGQDLARGKPATESSTYVDSSRHVAALAVDGNTDGTFSDGSVASTNADPNSWWQVDLGAVHPIGSVDVWNRTDCCGSRLADYWVFTSASPFDTSLTPAQQATQPGVYSSHQTTAPSPAATIALPNGTAARYVMVQEAPANTYLSLAEVIVHPVGG